MLRTVTDIGIQPDVDAIQVRIIFKDLGSPVIADLADLIDGTGLLVTFATGEPVGRTMAFRDGIVYRVPMSIREVADARPPIHVRRLRMESPLDIILIVTALTTSGAVVARNILALVTGWQQVRKLRAEARIAEKNADLHTAAVDFMLARFRRDELEADSNDLNNIASALLAIDQVLIEKPNTPIY